MRTSKLFTGFVVVTLVSLFTAGVMSAATPLSKSALARVCMHQMNPCNFSECQDWCHANRGIEYYGVCQGPDGNCCNCYL